MAKIDTVDLVDWYIGHIETHWYRLFSVQSVRLAAVKAGREWVASQGVDPVDLATHVDAFAAAAKYVEEDTVR